MRPSFIAPPSEYYTELEDGAGDPPHVHSRLNYEAARTPDLKQPQHHHPQASTPYFANAANHAGAALLTPAVTAALPTLNGSVVVPAAQAPNAVADSPTAEDVDVAMKDAVDLFISASSIEPAYELRGELGRGKYGRVFLVEDCVQHRLLAVKATYDPNWISAMRHVKTNTPSQQQQQQPTAKGSGGFMRSPMPAEGGRSAIPAPPATHVSSEVVCLRECNSPFIVRLEGAEKGEHGEDLLLMEYVDCGDLRQEIRRRRAVGHPFTETEVAFIFLQLCMAVDHLHQRNILHHDLKPENIMLSSSGIIKLGDFGFAHKYTEPVCNKVASTGCGTPYYLSPEALRGERYSCKSEMWALGVILYELMSLSGPFVAANRSELRAKVHEGHYPPLPTLYSAELRHVCVQLLDQDPARRPSVHELFSEDEYLRDLLNALRRTSECSTKMTTEEKGSMFYSISAALRRRSPTTPGGVAAGSTCSSWASSLNGSYGVGGSSAAGPAVAQRARLEI